MPQIHHQTTSSPLILQFQGRGGLQTRQLNAVRRNLRASGPRGDTVRNVAARWGFWHMGQFARDYRNLFGELPSQTLRGKNPD